MQFGAAPPSNLRKRIKISTIMDQGSDMEVDMLSATEITARRRVWFVAQGDHPREMQEVTDEQLSALSRILEAGLNPKIDMGIWGPHGERIERINKFRSWISAPDGGGRYVEVPGAACLDQWLACWEVYRTAMIMEQAVSAATLDKYMGDFRDMANQYSPKGCWHLCAQADIRCRFEYWPQLKRRMELFHQTSPQASSFEPARPWNSVIRESVGASAVSFWENALREPARLFMIENGNRGRRGDAPELGASVGTMATCSNAPWRQGGRPQQQQQQQQQQQRSRSRNGRTSAQKKQKSKTDRRRDKKAERHAGATTKDGKQICFSWNRSHKGCVDGQCPSKRAHVCELCGAQHRSINCKAPAADRKST